MDIFSELKKLNFPQDKYLVIGGAALAGRNLKQTRDLDILVEKDFLKELEKDTNWKYHPRIIPTEEAGLVNDDGTVELYPTVGGIDLRFEDMKTREETIEGFPFANLKDILRIKQAYHREKDLKDIELIETYLAR
jgi:hypothetical protein